MVLILFDHGSGRLSRLAAGRLFHCYIAKLRKKAVTGKLFTVYKLLFKNILHMKSNNLRLEALWGLSDWREINHFTVILKAFLKRYKNVAIPHMLPWLWAIHSNEIAVCL